MHVFLSSLVCRGAYSAFDRPISIPRAINTKPAIPFRAICTLRYCMNHSLEVFFTLRCDKTMCIVHNHITLKAMVMPCLAPHSHIADSKSFNDGKDAPKHLMHSPNCVCALRREISIVYSVMNAVIFLKMLYCFSPITDSLLLP